MIDEIDEHRRRLAHSFDHAFSQPFANEPRRLGDFLVLRLGQHWYALPVDELAGVQNKKTIQFLPDAPAFCLGLSGVRGRVAAIYDLGALIGSPSSDRLSWLLQAKADPEIALLVPKAERYLRAELDRIVPAADDGPSIGALSDDRVALNVLSVTRVVASIRARGGERA
ncbi:MAG TPA: chemotaxis protein CheW [Polyangiaceae bacterium]|nr:chemotaxis protein CheW [Polyangiaceae bacterium]